MKLSFRIITDLLLLISVVNGWWFIALPLSLMGAWNFPYFIEIILAGIAYDSLFGLVPEMGLWGYAGTIMAVIGSIVANVLKKIVRR